MNSGQMILTEVSVREVFCAQGTKFVPHASTKIVGGAQDIQGASSEIVMSVFHSKT